MSLELTKLAHLESKLMVLGVECQHLESKYELLQRMFRQLSDIDVELQQKVKLLESMVYRNRIDSESRQKDSEIQIAEQHKSVGFERPQRPICFLDSTTDSEPLDSNPTRDSEWLSDTKQLLECLMERNVETSKRKLAVLFAETTSFEAEETGRLLSGLHSFISENRFEDNADSLIYVGAAIRKYSMCMSESEFESYADWLRPSCTEAVSHQVELELTKGMEWRLSRVPVVSLHRHPKLMAALVSIAMDYTTKRLILQKNYASIALNTLVAIQLLAAFSDDELSLSQGAERVVNLRMPWFTELLCDRITEAAKAIEVWNSQLASKVRSRIVVYSYDN